MKWQYAGGKRAKRTAVCMWQCGSDGLVLGQDGGEICFLST